MGQCLQVVLSDQLEAKLKEAAKSSRISEDEWVRRAIERSLEASLARRTALDRLESLDAPTGDIDKMLAEIEAGRG